MKNIKNSKIIGWFVLAVYIIATFLIYLNWAKIDKGIKGLDFEEKIVSLGIVYYFIIINIILLIAHAFTFKEEKKN